MPSKSRHGIFVLCLTVGLALASYGGSPRAQTPAPHSLTAARDLLGAMGFEQQFKTILPLMMQQMSSLVLRQNPTKEAEIREVMGELVRRMSDRHGEMIELIAPLYANRFSLVELQELTSFYRSPLGAKLVASQPQLMAQQAQIGQQWGERIGRELDQEMRKELKRRGIEL